jgi:hypothetical protein
MRHNLKLGNSGVVVNGALVWSKIQKQQLGTPEPSGGARHPTKINLFRNFPKRRVYLP